MLKNHIYEPVFNFIRYKYTSAFLNKHRGNKKERERVLDIGGKNEFGVRLANEHNLSYHYSIGDLDTLDWTVSESSSHEYEVVFCFEVLEHLLNPLLLLKLLYEKKYIDENSKIFISVPRRPHFLWTPHHFHEFDKSRFEYLIDRAGYKIITYERSGILWRNWIFYFRGIKPILRLIWPTRSYFYLVRLK